MADQTFNKGQKILTEIVDKFHQAGERKHSNLSKLQERQANHIEHVMNTMEQSLLDEEERKADKLDSNMQKDMTFLQRLELKQKEKDELHRFKYDKIGDRR